MQVILSGKIIAVLVSLVIVGAVGAGIFHDQSIKMVYQSFTPQYSKEQNLTSQNEQLQNQIQQLQSQLNALKGLPKVTFVHGNITTSMGDPISIFFYPQSGPSLSSSVSPILVNRCDFCRPQPITYEYQAYLGSGITYVVWMSMSPGIYGVVQCTVPGTITPTGTGYSMNFSC